MTNDEMTDKMLLEIRTKSILPIQDYIPTLDHYVPIRFVKYYLELAYGIGYDKGRKMHSNSKKVEQIKNGEVVKIWDSQADAARAMKCDLSDMNKIIKQQKTYKGFEWKSVE